MILSAAFSHFSGSVHKVMPQVADCKNRVDAIYKVGTLFSGIKPVNGFLIVRNINIRFMVTVIDPPVASAYIGIDRNADI